MKTMEYKVQYKVQYSWAVVKYGPLYYILMAVVVEVSTSCCVLSIIDEKRQE